MASVAVTIERQPTVLPRLLLTYALIATVLITLLLTIHAMGSTSVGTPTPRPQKGSPVTLVAQLPSGSDAGALCDRITAEAVLGRMMRFFAWSLPQCAGLGVRALL
jgi:hypothetical protein